MELESLPEGWELKSLGEVTEIKAGNPAPQKEKYFENGDIPFVRMQDLGKYHRTTSLIRTTDKVNKQAVEECNLHIFPEGSVILPKSGSVYLNHRAILGINACVVSHIAILIPKSEVISEFLYYILCTIDMSKWGHKTTGLDSLNLRSLGKIKIPLPPLEEQKKIVEILQFADYLRERRKEAKELIDKIVMSVFYDMFGDPARNPKGWEVKRLGEIAQVIMGQSPPGKSYNNKGEGHPFLQGPTEFGKIFPIEERWTTQPKKFCEIDDTLISVRATIGEMNWADKKYCIGRGLAAIRANPNDVTQPFLWYILKCFRNELENLGGGSVFKSIKKRHLEEFEIPLPTFDLQQEFAEIVSKFEAKRRQMEEAEEKLEMLYQILLKQAFTGKLTEEWRMRH
jgi:type I restriction enzyme S subunit